MNSFIHWEERSLFLWTLWTKESTHDILLALALKYRFETSKHQQLIGWFNKTFIKDEIIERKYNRILRDVYKNRMRSDYDAFVTFTKEETEELFESMQDFVARLEQFILSEQ